MLPCSSALAPHHIPRFPSNNVNNKFSRFSGEKSVGKRCILMNSPSPLLKAIRRSSGNSTPNIFLNSLKLSLIDVTLAPPAIITSISGLFATEPLTLRAARGAMRNWKATESWKASTSRDTWNLFRIDVMWTLFTLYYCLLDFHIATIPKAKALQSICIVALSIHTHTKSCFSCSPQYVKCEPVIFILDASQPVWCCFVTQKKKRCGWASAKNKQSKYLSSSHHFPLFTWHTKHFIFSGAAYVGGGKSFLIRSSSRLISNHMLGKYFDMISLSYCCWCSLLFSPRKGKLSWRNFPTTFLT